MRHGVINNPNPHGAGKYGAPEPMHKTRCPNSNNPFGHSKECACGWWLARPSQTVPYRPAELHEYFNGPDCPSPVCDRAAHDECWRDYNRQEDAEKYRPDEGGF